MDYPKSVTQAKPIATMDITFNCPNCEQELEVDGSAAGSTLECPSCAQTITVPSPDPTNIVVPTPVPVRTPPPPPAPDKHFVVPMHSAPAEALIGKPNRPLDVAAKESDRKLRIKTFRHTEYVEVGRDRFDEFVSAFLEKVGQQNIVSVTPITYSTIDIGTHLAVTDFGVVIIFKG